MNNAAIGVFDSGLGGLTAVKKLNALLPNEDIIYFGDTARIPYGTRSRDTILKYASQDIDFLKSYNVKLIIAACGTVSSVMGNTFSTLDMPFTGVLLPAVQAACGVTRTGRIGVIGTTATIKSGAYGRAIRTIRPDAFVVGNACPLFVPLVENGFCDRNNSVAIAVARQYLAPIIAEDIDTLILGCTHYPLLADIISDILGNSIRLISAGEEAATQCSAILSERELLSESTEKGNIRYFVSDSVDLFTENAKIYLGQNAKGDVAKVDIDTLKSE